MVLGLIIVGVVFEIYFMFVVWIVGVVFFGIVVVFVVVLVKCFLKLVV